MTEMISDDQRPSPEDSDAYADWVESMREKAKLSSADEIKQRREADFPEAIQGRWLDEMDPSEELLIRGSEFIRSGEPWPYLDKLLLTNDADQIHLEIIFPGNEEEGSSTTLFLMDDGALGYATWHEACTYLRPDA
jgi:hypothetical protein